MKLKKLEVRVEYIVGLGDLEVPKAIGKELKEVFEKGNTVNGDDLKYTKSLEWLNAKIDNNDAFEWNYEIEECD